VSKITQGKEHILEVRVMETFQEKQFTMGLVAKSQYRDVSFIAFVYSLSAGEREKIIK
jgi:hypothetical protein